MTRHGLSETLDRENIENELQKYLALVGQMGNSIGDLQGIALFTALKRERICSGPYPDVTLFEAANRIMTDLVLLYGVRWILEQQVFGFTRYSVEYGHGNRQRFDLMARDASRRLIGEVFNVAPSFYPVKKNAMLKKMRDDGGDPDFTVIMCNTDALGVRIPPRPEPGEYLILVDVGKGSARMSPEKVANPSAITSALA